MGFPRAKPLGRSLVPFCRGQKGTPRRVGETALSHQLQPNPRMEAQRWDAQRKTTPGPAHGPKPRMETYPIAQNILRRQSGAEPRTTADRKERREGREECIPRPEILAAFCPKRKIAPRNLARGDFHLLHFTALDSRHFLPPCTTSSREAAGRGCQRVLTRRRVGCACRRRPAAFCDTRLQAQPKPAHNR